MVPADLNNTFLPSGKADPEVVVPKPVADVDVIDFSN